MQRWVEGGRCCLPLVSRPLPLRLDLRALLIDRRRMARIALSEQLRMTTLQRRTHLSRPVLPPVCHRCRQRRPLQPSASRLQQPLPTPLPVPSVSPTTPRASQPHLPDAPRRDLLEVAHTLLALFLYLEGHQLVALRLRVIAAG